MVLALLTILATSTPHTPTLRARLDVGALMGATWQVEQTRGHLLSALSATRVGLLTHDSLEFGALANAMPVVGPLLVADQASGFDRAMILTTSAFQLLGSVTTLVRWLSDDFPQDDATEPKILFAPLVAGHLGLSVRVTGF